MHYLISRYSVIYPRLFADLWGKPVFTFLSSPFSQAGFTGLQVFNIIVSTSGAFMAYKTARAAQMKFSWLALLFTGFAPMFFILSFSGLTEPLFGLFVLIPAYLFLKKKYYASAIIISFIPFVRNEGFIILPFYALAFILNRKWLPVLFLLTGTVLVSVAGYFYHHNILWIFTENPYKGAEGLYGSGSFWKFFNASGEIFGITFIVFILFGFIHYLCGLFKGEKQERISVLSQWLIIVIPVLVYFLAHSVLWWKGMGGSLRLTRVISGIIPLAAVIAVKGVNILSRILYQRKVLTFIAMSVIAVLMVMVPFKTLTLPFPAGNEESVLHEASLWIKSKQLDNRKIYSINPYPFVILDIDPFNDTRAGAYLPDRENIEQCIEPGSLVIWDAHFSPSEGGIPLEKIMSNKWYLLKNVFFSETNNTTMNGGAYNVYIFERLNDTCRVSNNAVFEQINLSYYEKQTVFTGSCPQADSPSWLPDSLKQFYYIDAATEFPTGGMKKVFSSLDIEPNQVLEISIDVYPMQKTGSINFVTSVDKGPEKVYFYDASPIILDSLMFQTWNTIVFRNRIPEIKSTDSDISVYLWNQHKSCVLFRNLTVNKLNRRQ